MAVVEEIRAKELEERGEAVPGWGTSTSRAKTTRGAMVREKKLFRTTGMLLVLLLIL